ncbi:DUF4030 domain-containing protein [Peribacillus sp. SCS-26]|uniref:DUF4030 domain-containing protein n=1 Tax=Paraperibacillus marinus TaxID=3115295 RepID=UPI0039063B74
MEDKLKNLRGSMTDTVLQDVVFDEKLESGIKAGIAGGVRQNKRKRIMKRIGVYSAAAVLLIGLFISSAFVSPVMADVASKIPYLKLLFKKEDINDLMVKELEKKHYKFSGLGVSYQPQKEFHIQLEGSKEYYDSIKGDVRKLAEKTLESQGYDAFKIVIDRFDASAMEKEPAPDAKELKRQALEKELNVALKKEGFDIMNLFVRDFKPDGKVVRDIQVEIPDTEKRVDELKQIIAAEVKARNGEPYPIKIRKINLAKREQDNRWGSVISAIAQDLMAKKDFHAKGIGYTVYPEPKITIRTEIKSTAGDAEEFGQNMEMLIAEFLQSPEMKELVKGDAYSIWIMSSDKKRLN